MNQVQWKMNSPIGPLYLVASPKGLHGLFLKKQTIPFAKSLNDTKEPALVILAQAIDELEEYFAGKRKVFNLPLAPDGTDFQKKVWNQLIKIPYGKTISYKELAKKIKNEKAVRAVGGANGKNPLCIIIPCHRVIAADGTLGGYSGGLDIKIKLLKLESDFQESLHT